MSSRDMGHDAKIIAENLTITFDFGISFLLPKFLYIFYTLKTKKNYNNDLAWKENIVLRSYNKPWTQIFFLR